MKKYIIVGLLFLIAAIITYFLLPNNESGNYGKLVISEVMASNSQTLKDSDGDYSDYIELYNGYDFDINLNEYILSDKEFITNKWTFPNITIKAKSYLLVFASGKDRYEEELHTNFKLSSNGEIVTLLDKDSNIISKIKYEKTFTDTSYGLKGTKYVYFYEGTPNKENTTKSSNTPINLAKKKIKVRINEYTIKNTNSIISQYGEYYDYLELYNYSDIDINLKGYYLSDNKNDLSKYMLPDVTIKAKDYLIVYLSGKEIYEEEVHANFKLGSNDKNLILSTGDEKIIDEVPIVNLYNNMSYGYKDNNWCYFMTPTPGYENNTKCFEGE